MDNQKPRTETHANTPPETHVRCSCCTGLVDRRLLAPGYVSVCRRLRDVRVRLVRARCDQARHEALKLDDAAWRALTYVGVQHSDGEALELRNCTCGSTLARVVEPAREAA